MIEWRAVAAVAIGAAFGGVLRYVVGQLFMQRFGPGFPYGTLFINVSGSLCIGIVAELAATRAFGMTPLLRILLATGVLGGYTTFSTFSFDAITLLGEGILPAFVYTAVSVVLGFAGAAVGVVLARLASR
ncbi:MAG TPA: fluoride efflux transporter CrcB [Candidatus Acidoferrum sp.]|jgi:fluoride exporter|nr:fluoride efflux transporter CrcB [Candidatus Acidoferrum sp.]